MERCPYCGLDLSRSPRIIIAAGGWGAPWGWGGWYPWWHGGWGHGGWGHGWWRKRYYR
ncbi:hypothetical protein [Propionispora hippei]|uniref:Uncharacterized protein n=1 Tax=Propionispora hippei DSM 15287 TaxID=1123003 RepID=A0A1M6P2H8_9FIRM|nr:hypothetical protein [Propionispora hippei]SHK02118.1 hypothetical protein SAMN02745170_03937 [Propionispora hippei DSM 15287]